MWGVDVAGFPFPGDLTGQVGGCVASFEISSCLGFLVEGGFGGGFGDGGGGDVEG